MYLCEVTVVAGGMISRSDRKCLCRWNSNADTLRMVYRKQPTLQLCVCARHYQQQLAIIVRRSNIYVCSKSAQICGITRCHNWKCEALSVFLSFHPKL